MALRPAPMPATPHIGDRVRIERDETKYPPRGTWPQFRGRIGTVVEVNADRKRPHRTEYGVVFGKVSSRTDGRGAFNHQGIVTWFKDYEMVRVAPERHADGLGSACPIGWWPPGAVDEVAPVGER